MTYYTHQLSTNKAEELLKSWGYPECYAENNNGSYAKIIMEKFFGMKKLEKFFGIVTKEFLPLEKPKIKKK